MKAPRSLIIVPCPRWTSPPASYCLTIQLFDRREHPHEVCPTFTVLNRMAFLVPSGSLEDGDRLISLSAFVLG